MMKMYISLAVMEKNSKEDKEKMVYLHNGALLTYKENEMLPLTETWTEVEPLC